MKTRVRFFVMLFSLGCCASLSISPVAISARGQSGNSQQQMPQVDREEAMRMMKEFYRSARKAFSEARKKRLYGLPFEDTFLAIIFRDMVVEKMYDPAMLGAAAAQFGPEYIASLKEASLQDFAERLRTTPKDPFGIERLGWGLGVFCVTSLVIALLSKFKLIPVHLAPSPGLMFGTFFFSLILCVIQLSCKVYRLSQRFMKVYQSWMQNLMEQQQKAQQQMMRQGGGGMGGMMGAG